jgi:membrane fusion protein, multidrug efflux system
MSMHEKKSSIKGRAITLIVICVLVVIGMGVFKYIRTKQEADRLAAEEKAGPHIQTVHPVPSATERTLSLVGEARPYASVTLYAKVSGYLKSIYVDKGDHVKRNQLLAVIESPETDKEYNGALADQRNKKAIAGRMEALRKRALVSPQEADQADSDAEVARSKLESLAVQKGYETLRAPMDGTVTARYADAGALVQNAANSQTSALPLVTVSQVDLLRVYVYVDQRDASYIKIGSSAKVEIVERPDLHLTAKVSRVSGELDPKTKMLLTEVDLENKDQALVPGSFVQVELTLQTPSFLQIPVQGMVVVNGNSMVTVIDKEDNLHYQEAHVGDNDGKTVMVISGLEPDSRVGLNVGSNLKEGTHVRPEEQKPKEGAAPAKQAEAAKPQDKPQAQAADEKPAAKTIDASPDAKTLEKANSQLFDKMSSKISENLSGKTPGGVSGKSAKKKAVKKAAPKSDSTEEKTESQTETPSENTDE